MDSTPPSNRKLPPVTAEDFAKDLGLEDGTVERDVLLKRAKRKTDKKGRVEPRGGHLLRTTRTSPNAADRLLYLKFMEGQPLSELAIEFGYNSATGAHNTIRKVHTWTLRAWRKSTRHLQSEQDMNLRQIHEMALNGYRASGRPKKITKKSEGTSEKGAFDKTEVIEEEKIHDPRYLNVALGALQQLADLHGLKAPTKVAHTDADGGPLKMEVIHKQLETADDATLKALRDANRKLLALSQKTQPEEVIDAEYEVNDAHATANPPAGPHDLSVRL